MWFQLIIDGKIDQEQEVDHTNYNNSNLLKEVIESTSFFMKQNNAYSITHCSKWELFVILESKMSVMETLDKK